MCCVGAIGIGGHFCFCFGPWLVRFKSRYRESPASNLACHSYQHVHAHTADAAHGAQHNASHRTTPRLTTPPHTAPQSPHAHMQRTQHTRNVLNTYVCANKQARMQPMQSVHRTVWRYDGCRFGAQQLGTKAGPPAPAPMAEPHECAHACTHVHARCHRARRS